jgi:serine/threonine protein kinase
VAPHRDVKPPRAEAQGGAYDRDAARLELDVARESIRGALFPRFKQARTLGRYELRRRIGDGGMGIVLAAHDPQLDREVAIKIVRPHIEDEGGPARLLDEARAVARLSHPNVVTIHDVGVHDGRIFVAMELVRGAPLRAWLQDDRPLVDILEVFGQAGAGLAAAHTAGLVHRDFKPGNVLVGDDGRVRVVDFGLAKPSAAALPALQKDPPGRADPGIDPSITHTGTGSILGTPAYMAPEQWIGGSVDARADQFAFCVCLYEAVFGVRPFAGETWIQIRDAVMTSPLRFPPRSDRVPAPLVAILERGLARLREHRYPDMHALLGELARVHPAPAEPTPELASVDRPAMSVPTSRARAGGYLASLPDGLASYPECRIDAALVRLALTRAPVDDAIVDAIRRDHGLATERWIPEACGRAVLALIADVHGFSPEAYDAFVRRTVRARLASGFTRFVSPPPASARAFDALTRAWWTLHRGTSLVVTDAGPGHASIALQHPPKLFDALARADVVQTLHAAMEHSGARVVDVDPMPPEPGRMRARVRWG